MNRLFTTAALLCALSLGFTSCSKDELYPTANRYIVMYKGEKLNNEADELYVIQAGSITAASGNATYNINFKRFIKQ
ncbi:hypothetical protein ACR78Z_24260 [Sphingobacterium thalpophilum]|uniref:Uncharacterized protein n=1 Tax=Sphingobacterium thalpophilum TaxID=259 RepID=A0A4U9VYA7_9SPHI|nr:hypothetical protein [Sphingobacterium thalpophilum]VTR52675.1 Uncharacterised protein [Sphingobacterium thalpophilum]